jgi:DNA-directed RNA polymerase subunit K/omega
MSDQRVYLDDIYASKECEGSVFRAVVMMAQEARFVNNQASQGYIHLNKKPTTIAMYKFKEGKLSMSEKKSNDVTEEAIAATQEAQAEAAVENVAANAEQADAAFGM